MIRASRFAPMRFRLNLDFALLMAALLLAANAHPSGAAAPQQFTSQTDSRQAKKTNSQEKKPPADSGSSVPQPVTQNPGPQKPQTDPATPSPPSTQPTGAPAQPSPLDGAQPQPAPAKAKIVWVNTASKVFHRPGSRWYGKTRHGKYMTEEDAIRAGYRPSAKE